MPYIFFKLKISEITKKLTALTWIKCKNNKFRLFDNTSICGKAICKLFISVSISLLLFLEIVVWK